jgi:hypothetical protein
LCCGGLWCVVLCGGVVCCVVLFCVVLCCVVLCCVVCVVLLPYPLPLPSSLNTQDNAAKYRGIAQLGLDFVNLAKTYGRVIISERPLPIEKKTVKPVTATLGGVAGGDKYIVRSILFKFATDVIIHQSKENTKIWMYGGRTCSHERAIKTAGHELQGLVAIHNCNVSGLRTPLMALIDFRGYRLIAQSFLPITEKTLVYGSSDGGREIRQSDSELTRKIEAAAKILNLSSHLIRSRETGEIVRMCGPGDLEGHCGLDGHHYVVDTGRVLPPCYARSSLTREDAEERVVFCKKLRAEFVRSYPFSLSSDAFTVWGKLDNFYHNSRVSRCVCEDVCVRMCV